MKSVDYIISFGSTVVSKVSIYTHTHTHKLQWLEHYYQSQACPMINPLANFRYKHFIKSYTESFYLTITRNITINILH